jgi:hypothetical protein
MDTGAILDYGFARLAAQPDGAADELLAVSRRDAAAGLLPDPSRTPPITPLVEPASPPQGGGVTDSASAPPDPPVSVAAQIKIDPDFSPIMLSPIRSDDNSNLFVLGIFLSIGFALLFLVARGLFRFNVASFAARIVANTLAAFDTDGETAPAPRTTDSRQRRRTPNLFVAEDTGCEKHLSRALQLAYEEREGSAMAEFLLALRSGPISIEDLTSHHRLPPTAFLALARAQTALGYYSDARATLIHGVTVLPQNRILSLALHQLNAE